MKNGQEWGNWMECTDLAFSMLILDFTMQLGVLGFPSWSMCTSASTTILVLSWLVLHLKKPLFLWVLKSFFDLFLGSSSCLAIGTEKLVSCWQLLICLTDWWLRNVTNGILLPLEVDGCWHLKRRRDNKRTNNLIRTVDFRTSVDFDSNFLHFRQKEGPHKKFIKSKFNC